MEYSKSFSREQIICFSVWTIGGIIPFTLPFIYNIAGRTSLIVLPLSNYILIPFAVWIMYLGRHFPGGTIFDLLEKSVGKIVSKIAVIAYVSINIILAAFLLNIFAGLVKVYFLQYTPSWLVILVIIVLCSIFALSEAKIFGFFMEFNFIIFTINFFGGNFISMFKYFKIEHIFPLMEANISEIFSSLLISSGTMSEVLLFFMIAAGSIHQSDKHLSWVFKGLTLTSLVQIVVLLVLVFPMGPQLLSRVAFAGINTASLIEVGEFVRGLEIFLLSTYQLIAFARVSIYLYCIKASLNALIKSRIPRLRILLVSILTFAVTIYINSINAAFFYSMKFGSYILFPYCILVISLASMGSVKKRLGDTALKQN